MGGYHVPHSRVRGTHRQYPLSLASLLLLPHYTNTYTMFPMMVVGMWTGVE